MRISYRDQPTKEYWNARWTGIDPDMSMENHDVYPLKYAELTVKDKNGAILEAGCGAGRLLRYYHERGFNCTGIDYIEIAIKKLKEVDPTLHVEVGDIKKLRFPDKSFKYVLAFGLYHNLEHGLQHAIDETYRVLIEDGFVCASFRADNLQNRLIDYLAERKSRNKNGLKIFHKLNLTKREFKKLFKDSGFEITEIYPVENMPFLYKFGFFRSEDHKIFDENKARKEGYRLSLLGQKIQNLLMRIFPDQFCNIYVLIAHKVR